MLLATIIKVHVQTCGQGARRLRTIILAMPAVTSIKYTFIGPSWRGLGCACVQLGASIAGDSCDGDASAEWKKERIR
jgi:hypothetical protein